MTAAAPGAVLAGSLRAEAVRVLANMTMAALRGGGDERQAKISSAHRDRLAVIYLRQSSMAQVREHTESTTRQYGLAEVAVALGWARQDVLVIDTDLGVSGRWGVARAGFTELVGRVCSGKVGAIFGIEISRLARSNRSEERRVGKE